jgi:hypothetical protein
VPEASGADADPTDDGGILSIARGVAHDSSVAHSWSYELRYQHRESAGGRALPGLSDRRGPWDEVAVDVEGALAKVLGQLVRLPPDGRGLVKSFSKSNGMRRSRRELQR